MAEAPEKKSGGGGKNDKGKEKSESKSNFFDAEIIILILVILGVIIWRIAVLWQNGSISNFLVSNGGIVDTIELVLIRIVTSFITFSNILSVLFFVGLVYAVVRKNQVLKEWHKKIYPDDKLPTELISREKLRWQEVSSHAVSDNHNDWRQAILEADIMLAELLDSLGYVGDTIGDKLKLAAKTPFKTLNAAWEAHRIRNAIAHEGQDFAITSHETRRTLALYESVFREFDWI